MAGNDRARACDLCQLQVYDIQGLSNAEVRDLIAATEGRFRGRLVVRGDGTVLTRDCPVGARAAAQRVTVFVLTLIALLAATAVVMHVTAPPKNRAKAVPQASSFVKAREAVTSVLAKYLPDWLVPDAWIARANIPPVGSPGVVTSGATVLGPAADTPAPSMR
jgi:hypothetical protein